MRLLLFFFACWSLFLSTRKAAASLIPDPKYIDLDLQAAAGDGWTLQRITLGPPSSVVHDNLGGLHVVTRTKEDDTPLAFDYMHYDGSTSTWASPERLLSVTPEDLLGTFQINTIQISLDVETDSNGNAAILMAYWQTGAEGCFLTRSPPTVIIARRDESISTWDLDTITEMSSPVTELTAAFDFRIALDAQDVPHISWRSGSRGPYFLLFGYQLIDGSWDLMNPLQAPYVDSSRAKTPGDIVINKDNGYISMAFCCGSANNLCFATSNDGGDTWVSQDIVTPESVNVCGAESTYCTPCTGPNAKLALAGDRPHIVHIADSTFLGGRAVFHTYLDNNGAWTSERVSNEPSNLDVAIAVSSSGKVGIAWVLRRNYPRTGAADFLLSEKDGDSWSHRIMWHAGNRGSISLTYVNEDPVSSFPMSPYYFSTEYGLGAGWSNSQVTELDTAIPWYADNGFTEENMNPYPPRPKGGDVVAFPVEFANQQKDAQEDYVVVTTRSAGSSLYIAFDDDGVFRTRMPQGPDRIRNMHTTSKSDLPLLRATAVGDFDGDGLTDFVIAGSRDGDPNGIIEFHARAGLNNLFQSNIVGPSLTVDTLDFYSSWLRDMAAADFDKDGNLDFIINGPSNDILLYLGNGDGSFKSPVALYGELAPYGLDTEDIDGDGNPDFAVVGNYYRSRVEIFYGNGSGGFSQVVYELGDLNESPSQTSQGVALGDFDADGIVDLVITNYAGSETNINGLAFFKGNGARIFETSAVLSGPEIGNGTTVFFHPRSVDNFYANSDDRFMDLIVADCESGKIFVYLGNGNGTFTLKPQRFFKFPSCGGGTFCLLDPNNSTEYDYLFLEKDRLQDISTKPYSELVPPIIAPSIDSILAVSDTLMSIQDVSNGEKLALQIEFTGFEASEVLINWGCDGTVDASYADLETTFVDGKKTVMLPPPTDTGVFNMCVNEINAPFHMVVYDPLDKSFTAGSGTVQSESGFLVSQPDIPSGVGTFNFHVRYAKKSGLPTGNILFELEGFAFNATRIDWLIVDKGLARSRGSGSVNDSGTFRFHLTGKDSFANKNDRFRIQIFEGQNLVYDNALGCTATEEECAPQIADGNVLVQDFNKRMLRKSNLDM